MAADVILALPLDRLSLNYLFRKKEQLPLLVLLIVFVVVDAFVVVAVSQRIRVSTVEKVEAGSNHAKIENGTLFFTCKLNRSL